MNQIILIGSFLATMVWTSASGQPADPPQRPGLKVGAAAAAIESDGSMVIAGGIQGWYAREQEGQLRAVSVVLDKPGAGKLAIVACDVLFVPRDLLDPVVEEI